MIFVCVFSYMVQVTDERDEEAYALSTEVITDDAPTFLTLKVHN